MRTIRRRLFVSHLLVMVVAIGVLVVGAGIVFGLVALIDDGAKFDERDSDGPGALGLLVPIGAALIAAGLVSWWVSRRLSEPIESVRSATRQIASGDYDVVVDGGETTELAQLADDVNRLADELDSTEQRRLRLIGEIGHELRNPLATIEGSLEALMDGVIAADDETYANIAREAARLRRLAGDLSALSAASEAASPDQPDIIDLGELARTVATDLAPQAAAKGITLTVDAPTIATVSGSGDRLTQVLVNVVGNAVQYTDHGTVSIAVRTGSHRVEVTVTDTGRGIAPDDLERVFERFYRVDEHFADGTGVGLAIARALVESHQGTIVARSDGLGTGSTFVIDLPRAV